MKTETKDGLILSALKLVVTFVVIIVTVTFALIKMLCRILADASAQAKDASPAVKDALKEHAANVASKAPVLAKKADHDIRKAFKLRLVKNTDESEQIAS